TPTAPDHSWKGKPNFAFGALYEWGGRLVPEFGMGLESIQVGSGSRRARTAESPTGRSSSTRPPLTLEAQHSMSSTTEAAPAKAGRTRSLYRGDPGMWSWVLHRITGVATFFFLFVHVLDTALVR